MCSTVSKCWSAADKAVPEKIEKGESIIENKFDEQYSTVTGKIESIMNKRQHNKSTNKDDLINKLQRKIAIIKAL